MQLNNILEDFNGDKDMANLRFLSVNIQGNPIEVKLDRTDPYGLINIQFQGTETPSILQGHYTSYELARNAITSYVQGLPSVSHTPKKKK